MVGIALCIYSFPPSLLLLTKFLHAVFKFCFQGHSQVNFVSTLLRITMSEQLDLPVRQAG